MQLILLTVLNVILIGVVIMLLSIRKAPPQKKSELSSELEGFDLIEFQQNLKNLIEELNSSAQSSIKDMENKKAQLEDTLRSAHQDQRVKIPAGAQPAAQAGRIQERHKRRACRRGRNKRRGSFQLQTGRGNGLAAEIHA